MNTSCSNGLMNCYRRFNADIKQLYISAFGHARELKFRSCVHLPFINSIFQYRHTL